MGKPTGFMEFERKALNDRAPLERVKDYAPIHLPLSEKNRREQSGRCMDCGVPFCQAGISFEGKILGCPLHNLIPEWNDLLWSGNYASALQRLLKTNCFPEFTGRVCPALCERACTCGMISRSVTVHDNECAIIDYAFDNDMMQPQTPSVRSDKTIAIVGSGPAGLAAAYYLNRRGHNVVVYERDELPGGLLTYGIAAMKLSQSIVARRIHMMEQEGIVFKTGCNIGKNVSLDELKGYDLVIFACGAQKPRKLSFPQEANSGVYYCLEYMKEANLAAMNGAESKLSAKGKHVIVIGAGDSASDCVAMAMRQGCKDIHQLVRRGAEDYTGAPDYAHEESDALYGHDIRQFSTQVSNLLLDEKGILAAVETNHGETIAADLLLIASGFQGCEDYTQQSVAALKESGVSVLTCGDMVSGATLVVQAIASGKAAAADADRHLMGYTNIL